MNKGKIIKLGIPVLSLCSRADDSFLVVSKGKKSNELDISVLNSSGIRTQEFATLTGSRSFLINTIKGKLYVGVDNKLILNDHGTWKTVIKSKNKSNFFWHMCASDEGTMYAQEYGEHPCNIYMSEDGEQWKHLGTAKGIDKRARHFHSIAYDQYRRMLLATLGDGNYIRIASLRDSDCNWRPFYRGAWQVVSITVLKSLVVFGMDSAIAPGGLVLWHPENSRIEVLHLQWRDKRVKYMQMADLKLLKNGIWVAALGSPQAIIASCDLRNWVPMYVKSFDAGFNHSIGISEGKNTVAFTTGNSVIVLKKDYLSTYVTRHKPVIREHMALFTKLKGIGYDIKCALSR
ncbi:MAG: hypothetical protein ABSB28_01740 [Candidatus Bathyarchaeia archaeon]